MAQLTWRNIEAPNISTRDLALANQTINASFGQLAQTLRDREAALRKEAEDQLAVGVYTAKDDAGINAAIQRALTGNTRERAAARAIAELGDARRDTLMGRQKTQNELDLFQAQRLFGDDAAQMYTAALGRDDAGYARAMETMRADAEFGRLGGLVLPGYTEKYADLRGSADTRFETGQNNLRIDARAREGNAIQSRRVALAEREAAERATERALKKQAEQDALNIIRSTNPLLSTADAAQTWLKSDAAKGKDPTYLRTVLNMIEDPNLGRDAYLRPTEDQQNRAGGGGGVFVPGINLPGYMTGTKGPGAQLVPGGIASPAVSPAVAATATDRLKQDSARASQILQNRLYLSNPALKVVDSVEKGNYADITRQELEDYVGKNTGISVDNAREYMGRYGLSEQEMRALLDVVPKEYWTTFGESSEREFQKIAERYSNARLNDGDSVATRQRLANSQAVYADVASRAERAQSTLNRLAAQNMHDTPQYIAAAAQLEKYREEMNRELRKLNELDFNPDRKSTPPTPRYGGFR